MEDRRRSLGRAVAGTVVFVLFVGPGPLIGLVPLLLSGWRFRPPLLGWAPGRWLGVALLAAGGPVLAEAIVRFVRAGRGTPAPVAPPDRLVVTGLYRYVRNPMYLGVLAMIVGQALLLGSAAVGVYAGIAALGFHTFVIAYEEPTLRHQFGEQYEAYCRRVRRWLPRARASGAEPAAVR